MDSLEKHKRNMLVLEFKEEKGIPSFRAINEREYIKWLEGKIINSKIYFKV